MTKTTTLVLLMALAVTATAAEGTETPPAHTNAAAVLANNCFTCHGPGGKSPGEIPSIDHLSAADLATAMKQFRSGERAATVMNRQAKGYADAEIEAVAAYIAGLKGGAK